MSHEQQPFIIALAGQKGGAGKSTLAIAVAAELHRRGYTTTLVDADTQGTALTWSEVSAEREDQTYTPPLVVALGDNLFRDLPKVAQGRDVVVVDCPGRIGKRQKAALAHADLAILPISPDATDTWALAESLELVEEAQQYRADLKVCLLLNKMRVGTLETLHARELFSPEDVPFPLMNAVIGFRVAYSRFPHEGWDLATYAAKHRGASKALVEVESLVSEIEIFMNEEEIPDGINKAAAA